MSALGLNVPTLTTPGRGEDLIDGLVDRIHELGVEHIRVPLQWRVLQADDGDASVLESQKVEVVREKLSRLDPDIRVLAMLTKPPDAIVERYFDQSVDFGEAYARYAELCAKAFDRVDDWEIWNEPNASDFYMSIRAGGRGHRPWNPSEFVSHVYLPAARVLRELTPNARICVGAVAENGIVGHTDAEPALSNLLPKTARFEKLRGGGRHSHFHFIPSFAIGLFETLSDLGPADRPDAVAFHPYPYFRIPEGTELSSHSLDLTREFCRVIPGGVEVWVTEVGARTIDPRFSPYRRDTGLQREFIEEYLAGIEYTTEISRVYWYKAMDRIRDLLMEKTFGLVDIRGNPRQVFFYLKSLNLQRPRPYLIDRFERGLRQENEVLDPDAWKVDASSPFSFMEHEMVDGESRLRLSTGRYDGDTWQISPKRPIDCSHAKSANVRIDLTQSGPARELEIRLTVIAGEASVSAALDLTKDGTVALMDGSGQVTTGPIESLGLEWDRSGEVRLEVGTVGGTITSDRLANPLAGDAFSFIFEVTKREGGVTFLEFSRIEAFRQT